MNIDLAKTQSYLEWLKTKLFLDSIVYRAKNRVVKRGQVYWCHFGINIGNEMSKQDCRPCVIIQNDIGNLKSPNTIVIPITHDTDTSPYLVPFTEQFDATGTCVLDGKINVSNVVCISKARLSNPVYKDGVIVTIPNQELKNVDVALAKTIDLMHYYSSLKDQYDRSKQYIEKIKKERNEVQDLLSKIRNELEAKDDNEILDKIRNKK